MKRTTLALTLGVTFAAASAIAAVGSGYTLFGSASYVSPGNASNRAVKLVADANAGIYSGVNYGVPANLTIDNLNTLSTDYNFTANSCANGSPRFAIKIEGYTGTIFAYIGPPPGYTDCPMNVWTNSGNVLTTVDTSQLPGGTFYEPWSTVQARFAGAKVTDIFIVSDNGPGAGGLGSQTVLIDNTNVNGTIYTYEPASQEDCKNGGWQNFTFAPGPFKNQGQCVSHFASNGHGNH